MNDTSTAFLVPSTTRNRDWETIEDTYLYHTLLRTLDHHCPDVSISVYIGYDDNDKIYSQATERMKMNAIFTKFSIIWVAFKPDPGNVVAVWNGLFKIAMNHGFEWFKILGDDIRLPNDPAWLRLFQKRLKKQNYIGWAAGYNGNDNIATQFLIHRTHWNIFEFVFPRQIKNWFCDDWLFNVYPEKYRYWRKDYPLLNIGGDPRYLPNDDKKLCEMLLRKYKKEIPEFVNMISKIKK
tara:strand:- start:692 stop:1402 length:711 start_codon:yes stop_codon:yes gene_type:complete